MESIEVLESKLNIRFPEEFNRFVSTYSNQQKIVIKTLDVDTVIQDFLPIETCVENSVYEVYLENSSLMLDGIIPIATTQYDDLICLFYRDSRENEPIVIYWSYELSLEEREEGIFKVANSFSEFLELYANNLTT